MSSAINFEHANTDCFEIPPEVLARQEFLHVVDKYIIAPFADRLQGVEALAAMAVRHAGSFTSTIDALQFFSNVREVSWGWDTNSDSFPVLFTEYSQTTSADIPETYPELILKLQEDLRQTRQQQ